MENMQCRWIQEETTNPWTERISFVEHTNKRAYDYEIQHNVKIYLIVNLKMI